MVGLKKMSTFFPFWPISSQKLNKELDKCWDQIKVDQRLLHRNTVYNYYKRLLDDNWNKAVKSKNHWKELCDKIDQIRDDLMIISKNNLRLLSTLTEKHLELFNKIKNNNQALQFDYTLHLEYRNELLQLLNDISKCNFVDTTELRGLRETVIESYDNIDKTIVLLSKSKNEQKSSTVPGQAVKVNKSSEEKSKYGRSRTTLSPTASTFVPRQQQQPYPHTGSTRNPRDNNYGQGSTVRSINTKSGRRTGENLSGSITLTNTSQMGDASTSLDSSTQAAYDGRHFYHRNKASVADNTRHQQQCSSTFYTGDRLNIDNRSTSSAKSISTKSGPQVHKHFNDSETRTNTSQIEVALISSNSGTQAGYSKPNFSGNDQTFGNDKIGCQQQQQYLPPRVSTKNQGNIICGPRSADTSITIEFDRQAHKNVSGPQTRTNTSQMRDASTSSNSSTQARYSDSYFGHADKTSVDDQTGYQQQQQYPPTHSTENQDNINYSSMSSATSTSTKPGGPFGNNINGPEPRTKTSQMRDASTSLNSSKQAGNSDSDFDHADKTSVYGQTGYQQQQQYLPTFSTENQDHINYGSMSSATSTSTKPGRSLGNNISGFETHTSMSQMGNVSTSLNFSTSAGFPGSHYHQSNKTAVDDKTRCQKQAKTFKEPDWDLTSNPEWSLLHANAAGDNNQDSAINDFYGQKNAKFAQNSSDTASTSVSSRTRSQRKDCVDAKNTATTKFDQNVNISKSNYSVDEANRYPHISTQGGSNDDADFKKYRRDEKNGSVINSYSTTYSSDQNNDLACTDNNRRQSGDSGHIQFKNSAQYSNSANLCYLNTPSDTETDEATTAQSQSCINLDPCSDNKATEKKCYSTCGHTMNWTSLESEQTVSATRHVTATEDSRAVSDTELTEHAIGVIKAYQLSPAELLLVKKKDLIENEKSNLMELEHRIVSREYDLVEEEERTKKLRKIENAFMKATEIKSKVLEFSGQKGSIEYFNLDEPLNRIICLLDNIDSDGVTDVLNLKVDVINYIQCLFKILDANVIDD